MIIGINGHLAWTFQSNDAVRGSLLNDMAAWGAKSVRLDYSWAAFEPTKGNFQWGQLDKFISEIGQRGMTTLPMLYWPPSWSSPGGKSGVPSNPADYGRAIGAVGARYGNKLAGIEMWNEPDLPAFWSGSQLQFINLLAGAYPVAKQISPSTTFIAAAPTYVGLAAPASWFPNAYNDSRFLPGVSFDAVACHPYMSPADLPPNAPATNWSINGINALKALRASKGDNSPLWATEFGWSTHSNTGGEAAYKKGITEAQQAAYTTQALQIMNTMDLAGAYIYTDVDTPTEDPHEHGFGLLRSDYSKKPVIQALIDLDLTTAPPAPLPPSELPPNYPPALPPPNYPSSPPLTGPGGTPMYPPYVPPPDPIDSTDAPIDLAPDGEDLHGMNYLGDGLVSTDVPYPVYPPRPEPGTVTPEGVMTWDDYPPGYTWADHPAGLTWDNLRTVKDLEAA